MAKSVSDLMASDRVITCVTIGVVVIWLACTAIFVQAVIIDILSVNRGLLAKSTSYVPRGSSVMWRISVSAPHMHVTGDLTRIAVAREPNMSASIYDMSDFFCGGSNATTPYLCTLSRGTLRAGTTKMVADFGYFFTLIIVSVAFQLMHKIDISVVATGAILCAGFSNIGVAAASAQVIIAREFARSVEYVAGGAKLTFTAAFGSIFATSCIEVLTTIALIGAYVVYRRRCKK